VENSRHLAKDILEKYYFVTISLFLQGKAKKIIFSHENRQKSP
jgi:hypothetical protein